MISVLVAVPAACCWISSMFEWDKRARLTPSTLTPHNPTTAVKWTGLSPGQPGLNLPQSTLTHTYTLTNWYPRSKAAALQHPRDHHLCIIAYTVPSTLKVRLSRKLQHTTSHLLINLSFLFLFLYVKNVRPTWEYTKSIHKHGRHKLPPLPPINLVTFGPAKIQVVVYIYIPEREIHSNSKTDESAVWKATINRVNR